MTVATIKIPASYIFAVVTVAAITVIAGQIVENPTDYFLYSLPAGQLPYVISKIAGSCAVFLLGIQIVVGLLGRCQESLKLHKLMGITLLLTILLHIALFITAASLRSGHLVLGDLVPRFSEGFYRAMVSVGALAFWASCVVVVAGVLRSKGGKAAVWLHRLAIPIFLAASLHALWIGTEIRDGPLLYLYIIEAIAVLSAMGWRLYVVYCRKDRSAGPRIQLRRWTI